MKTYSFIFNPQAGKGKGGKLLNRLHSELMKLKLDAEVILTEGPGHATKLANASPATVVVAVGGDGTVNEVANGLIGSAKTLAVIPNGSGNDLVKSMMIPAQFDLAMEKLVSGNTRLIDYATVACNGLELKRTSHPVSSRCFINGVGIGFDAAVADRTNRMRFVKGTASYVLAVFQTLGKYKSPDFSIKLDSKSYESRNLLIAVGNGRCAGGGFYLTPDADLYDGLLDVCMIDEISIARILMIMPRVMKGAHAGFKGVSFARAKHISVSAEKPFFVHADGEIVGRNVNSVDIQIVERSLKAIVGK